MIDRVAVHNHLSERLQLPSYYGRNLDALYDVLTEIGDDTEIVLENPAAVAEQLGKYGEALLSTMQEAAESNAHLTITLK
jgi:ribonuclease inhibitor